MVPHLKAKHQRVLLIAHQEYAAPPFVTVVHQEILGLRYQILRLREVSPLPGIVVRSATDSGCPSVRVIKFVCVLEISKNAQAQVAVWHESQVSEEWDMQCAVCHGEE